MAESDHVPRVHVQVVLLDHIPHWDAAGPTPYVQSTYVPYKMSVFIPDIACKQVRAHRRRGRGTRQRCRGFAEGMALMDRSLPC